MDHRQYREDLIRIMVAAYRDIRRLDKKLKSAYYNRTFKNTSCPTAVKINRDRQELLGRREEAWQELRTAFNTLPEVQCLYEPMEIGVGAYDFAAKCAAKPRGRRFMKNQLELAT